MSPSPHPHDPWWAGSRPVCEGADDAFLPPDVDPGPCSASCPVHGQPGNLVDTVASGPYGRTMTTRKTPRRPRSGNLADFGLDPVSAARTRIEVCERYGMEIDPRDVAIVAAADKEQKP